MSVVAEYRQELLPRVNLQSFKRSCDKISDQSDPES